MTDVECLWSDVSFFNWNVDASVSGFNLLAIFTHVHVAQIQIRKLHEVSHVL